MAQPADVRALWSGFAAISDSDIDAQIKAAEREITAYLASQGIELEDDGLWSEEDYEYAVILLAAHYVALVHRLALSSYSYSIGGISESFSSGGADSELEQTVFGRQYNKLLRLKGGGSRQPLARTG